MKKLSLSIIGLLACTASWAICSPVNMLQTTSNKLIVTLQQNQATLKTKPQVVYSIVKQVLLQHVDLANMSKTALGRDAWMQAKPAQKKAFTEQFTTLLIRTYASALAQYTDEKINFLPLRGDFNKETRVQVNSNIVRDAGPPINISYRLMRVGDQWKVYDFSVDGISLVQSFRSQFAQELKQAGIDGLINKLAQHNAQNNG